MKAGKIIVFFLFIMGVFNLMSNNPDKKKNAVEFRKQFEQAEGFIVLGRYIDASNIYKKLYTQDAGNYNLCYKLGLCYLKSPYKSDMEKAAYFLEKASKGVSRKYDEGSPKERKAPTITYKLLGEAFHQDSKFDLAIEALKKYEKLLSVRDHELINEIKNKIDVCNTAIKLVEKPVNAEIVNMGETVNSPYPDYSPVFTADQSIMIFTSRRPENKGGKTYDGGKYFEDIYISTRTDSGWSKAVNIGSPINTVGNEASVGISADGQEILIYKDDMGDGNIYSTSLKGKRWTIPKKLNGHINSKSWEPSAFISSTGNTLYFVSDRPGGYGGRDIYKSEKNANGEWGRAVNLGSSINTKGDEDGPFLHPDGKTLYFSSNRHETMGGFDIFESTLMSDGHWSEPVNIGYPINSPADDVFYVVSADKKTAHYTSMRNGGYGEKDNYTIIYPDAKEPALTLQKGTVLDNNQNVIKNVKITVTDNETREVIGVYHPNATTGKYLFVLTPGKSHNILYEAEGSLFYSENIYVTENSGFYERTKSVNLSPIAVGSKVILNNIFFDFDKTELRPYSNVELNKLYDFMLKYPHLAIEIAGYTDSKGTDEYNVALSKGRADAVVTYLIEKGVPKERMIAIGYGKANPVAPNLNTDGSDNPEGRQLNRRVELKIIDIKIKP
jgi:outer membrane protein OmpA-like peptidoglycan-associated protein